tara:strand:+ start:1229 stop:1513 length:285 start_codon:yes stop_codon:yes gene_type:complete
MTAIGKIKPLDLNIQKGLGRKVLTFQKKNPKINLQLNDLEQIFKRGEGAYLSSGSRRVPMAAWAYGRVNKWLEQAAKGKPKFDTDIYQRVLERS